MPKIPLKNGKHLIVDSEDFDFVSKYKWYLSGYGYVHRKSEDNKTIYLHKELLNSAKGLVDHINGNPLDNRRINLRLVSREQNVRNSRKTKRPTSSQYKGVCWDKQMNKWRVKIRADYKQIFIGLFDTENQAALAYDLSARNFFGEYAKTNFSI